MTSNKGKCRGFTLIELLVVMSMILIIVGAMGLAVNGAHERARAQRALSDVKVITQAILAYENESPNGDDYELPTMEKAVCDRSSLGFLLGRETSQSGKVPVMLMAQLASGGKMLDPWGHPYYVTIRKGGAQSTLTFRTKLRELKTGFYLPNLDRIREEER